MIPQIAGILNMTTDSFSDGGLFIDPEAALRQAGKLMEQGASIIDIGAVSSNPAGVDVPVQEEIDRLKKIVPELLKRSISISIDSFRTPVQRYFLRSGVQFLNDIAGFPDPAFYPELSDSDVRLIIMHSVQRGRARIEDIDPETIPRRLIEFFDERIEALEQAGVERHRMILDPGMGHFLGRDPECSIQAIRFLPDLKARYGTQVLVSVSRKSFLGAITGRDIPDRLPATLAAELASVMQGADYIRTHEPGPLLDACKVMDRIYGDRKEYS
jgi:dihydropteroate synthase type 2/dihydropteroate synthase type 3